MLCDDLIDPCGFSSVDDVVQKLSRTFVVYKGTPVYVTNIVDMETVTVVQDSTTPAFQAKIKDIDYSAPKLGMYFSPQQGTAIAVSRKTYRQYKGGLPPETLQMRLCTHSYSTVRFDGDILKEMFSDNFIKMLKNEYQSVTECLNLLRKNPKIISVPFRRFHWLSQNKSVVTLFFKDYQIISYDYKTKTFSLGGSEIVSYQQQSLSSIINNQVEEFRNYVTSV